MRFITDVKYNSGFKLLIQFEDGQWRLADLENHLEGEVFEPLRDPARFQSARLNRDIDTVVWDNGADMSPDFLYQISVPWDEKRAAHAAESRPGYGKTRRD